MRSLLLLLGIILSFPAAAACPRIVSQSPYITHQLEWLGLADCIVGASRYERRVRVPDTGGVMDPDAQAIAAVQPDLVITSTWTKPDVLAAVTPPSARAMRLASFQRMDQIEENLREIGAAARLDVAQARAAAFAYLWRKKAAAVGARGERVLLLSSCTGQPYSFGRNTWLGELFEAAGFRLAETNEGVRHLARDATAEDIERRVTELRPDLVVIFTRQIAESCAAVPWPANARLMALDGEKFLHPAPVLLEGLDELAKTYGDLYR
ncbi:ABC transporter substrate-binding protein [Sulfuricystis multivorans]|uniref:ABC transporter substrate-binding protein n=1 Tax=Sulfuricystis multivorans TaxID=2211108 RepID=UPI000F84CBF0|nr:ABC transporter substrate-binding protein [Sulfuricystis multivorans]